MDSDSQLRTFLLCVSLTPFSFNLLLCEGCVGVRHPQGQKSVPVAQGLELQAIVRGQVGARNESQVLRKVISTLNH